MDEFLDIAGKINKEELRLNFERAKEYMTSYEIADSMKQVFTNEEIGLIVDSLTLQRRF